MKSAVWAGRIMAGRTRHSASWSQAGTAWRLRSEPPSWIWRVAADRPRNDECSELTGVLLFSRCAEGWVHIPEAIKRVFTSLCVLDMKDGRAKAGSNWVHGKARARIPRSEPGKVK